MPARCSPGSPFHALSTLAARFVVLVVLRKLCENRLRKVLVEWCITQSQIFLHYLFTCKLTLTCCFINFPCRTRRFRKFGKKKVKSPHYVELHFAYLPLTYEEILGSHFLALYQVLHPLTSLSYLNYASCVPFTFP